MINNKEPRTDPCGTPVMILETGLVVQTKYDVRDMRKEVPAIPMDCKLSIKILCGVLPINQEKLIQIKVQSELLPIII